MQKQGLVLTGGVNNGCSDDMLVASKLMVDLVVVTMDSLAFFPGNIWLVRGVSTRECVCHRLLNKPSTDLMYGEHVAEKVHEERR